MQIFAETAGESQGLIQALGLNAQLFIEQGLAFLILVFILGKFVYPALIKAIDDRRNAIEAGLEEAKEAAAALQKAETQVAEMLATSRKEADEIIARAHQESTTMISQAEDKAKTRADQIVTDARAQLEIDVAKAREVLKRDTIQLVALATEKIVGEKLDERKDAKLIENALKETV